MSPATSATKLLSDLSISWVDHFYDHDARAESFGLEAATALGVDPARVFKTLMANVADSGEKLIVGVIPVSEKLDLKKLAMSLGFKRAEMASPLSAERSSGYVVGGISPVGQRRALPTAIDESAQLFDTIFVSGGKRGFDIEISPADLLRATNSTFVDLCRS
ncbi:MAG: Cys-tRNA(Pro) deacylase [Actinomycetes bacterium]